MSGGTVRAVTQRAVITDAIPEGSISMSTTFDPDVLTKEFVGSADLDVGAAAAVQGASAIQSPLSCSDSGVSLATTFDGSIEPSLDLDFDWSPSGLHQAEVTADLDLVIDITATATAKVTCALSKNLFTYNLAAVVVPIAGIPIVFLPELSVDLAVSGALEGSIGGSAQYRVDTTSGFIYDENTGITKIKQATPSATAAWTAGAKATAELAVTPALAVYVFGAVGPKASVPFGVGVELDPCRTPLWKLGGSVKAQFGLSLSSWLGSLSLANVDITLVDSPITQGGTAIADFPGCDLQVEVVSHNYSVSADASANRDEDPINNGSSDYFSDSKRSSSAQFGPGANDELFVQERTNRNGVITGGTTVVGSYTAASWNAGRSETAGVSGANASADASLAVGLGSTASSWQWDVTASTNASASASSDGDVGAFHHAHDADGDADALATISVVLQQDALLTVTPRCPTMPVSISGGGVNNISDACIDPVVLPAGQFQFRTSIGVSADAKDGSTASDGASGAVTLSLTPA